MNGILSPAMPDGIGGVTEENIQSRLRGVILMALSNKTGDMLVTTGNKSEVSVGYATLYGDMNGALIRLKISIKQKFTNFRLCEMRFFRMVVWGPRELSFQKISLQKRQLLN